MPTGFGRGAAGENGGRRARVKDGAAELDRASRWALPVLGKRQRHCRPVLPARRWWVVLHPQTHPGVVGEANRSVDRS